MTRSPWCAGTPVNASYQAGTLQLQAITRKTASPLRAQPLPPANGLTTVQSCQTSTPLMGRPSNIEENIDANDVRNTSYRHLCLRLLVGRKPARRTDGASSDGPFWLIVNLYQAR